MLFPSAKTSLLKWDYDQSVLEEPPMIFSKLPMASCPSLKNEGFIFDDLRTSSLTLMLGNKVKYGV